MMGRLSPIGAAVRPLDTGWTLLPTGRDACAAPGDVPLEGRIAAVVPGTAADALGRAGRFDKAHPTPLIGHDIWYFRSLSGETPGPAILRLEGLATIADVYLNGTRVLSCDSMFESHDIDVRLTGEDDLAICCRALLPHLEKTGPRARFRPQMMDHQGLRLVRTTTLGHMPGWCPDIHAVGPFRPISLIRPGRMRLYDLSIRAQLSPDGEGRLDVRFRSDTPPLEDWRLSCADGRAMVTSDGEGGFSASLALPGIRPWWPHTHGTPALYDVTLIASDESLPLCRTGFRSVALDRGADGRDFQLVVNGTPVFCRGAVWTNADIARLPGTREDYAPWLTLAREAGMNMIRIGGTMTYESPEFFALCDELGLLVWQDFMFANFDYPVKDETLVAHVRREAEQLLAATGSAPSLAVLCGGSEIDQQAAMLGLPHRIWNGPLTSDILPGIAQTLRPDVPYVPNSPSGGAMPFSANEGVTHYYGVGAYCRPLEDARRAQVRFAAESLAFSNIPEQRTLDAHLPVAPVHDPGWKATVPRDRGASWDFEDIRDHYLALLYGVDPARLRREDRERYLDLSRAVSAEVVEATFGEWRRHGSSCHGALVWTLQDLVPGAGWGVIDATGEPKPVYHGLKRAFRPIQVLLSDEGTNGISIHILNETAQAIDATLEITCLRGGEQSVVSGSRDLTLAARSSMELAATDLFGAFFDTGYAFRFGPPSHDVTVARLKRPDRTVLSESFHFPLGRAQAFHDGEIESRLRFEGTGWVVDLKAFKLAQSVHIDCEGYRPQENWFHLAPGSTRAVALLARAGTDPSIPPTGEIRTVSSARISRF